MIKPTPLDKEKFIQSDIQLMIKADRTGAIEYVNFDFVTMSEYEIEELIGKDMSFLNHPDMPSLVYDHIWADLFQKKRSLAIIKNITKKGKFYWLQVDIDYKVNEATREIESIYLYYSQTSRIASEELNVFYKKLKDIETHAGNEAVENFLKGYLENKELNYDSFIKTYLK